MIQIRKSEDRGHAKHGWLDSYHTFSFANYYDPKHMGFRTLRVINEDRVAPGGGFGAHGHRNMEILSYVLDGSLAHKDSMGNQEVLGPNEIQRMSAGAGITHSEFNPSTTDPVHFLQIWIEPATMSGPASYEQIRFDPKDKQGRLKLLASAQGGNGVARINQDARVFVTELADDENIDYGVDLGRHVWLHVIRGGVMLNGSALKGGDAASVSREQRISITGEQRSPSEVLLFDLG